MHLNVTPRTGYVPMAGLVYAMGTGPYIESKLVGHWNY